MLAINALQAERAYFAVISDALLPGDVLLTTNPKSPASFAIRKATNSPYSHAILCVDPPWCVESIGYGILRFMINRFLLTEKENIHVCRLKDHGTRAGKAEAAANYANNQVSREYAHLDVLTVLFKAVPPVEQGKFFCSQLIAECYSRVGVHLVPNRGPAKVSPGDIARSDALEDVTKRCVREATESDKLNFTAFLDGEKGPTPHTEEVLLKQELVRQLSPVLSKYHLVAGTYDDLLEALVKGWKQKAPWVSEIDQSFSDTIVRSGLLDLSHKHNPPHDDHYFLDCYLLRLLNESNVSTEDLRDLKQHYLEILKHRDASIQETEEHARLSRQLFVLSGLESVRLNGALLEENQAVKLRQRAIIGQCVDILSRFLGEE